jgi:hypothetical protein
MDDYLETIDGVEVYAADIANYIIHGEETLVSAVNNREGALTFDADVRYCFVSGFLLAENKYALVAHIVLRDKKADLNGVLQRLETKLGAYFPDRLLPIGYRIYDDFLPDSMHKTDRKFMISQLDGYFQPSGNGLECVGFIKDESSGFYSVEKQNKG